MITITRKLWFSYGHRVFGHESACANIHGHNAVLLVTVCSPQLDGIGRVIDFKELKTLVDTWIQTHWDHAFLWYEKDPVGQYLYGENSRHSTSPVTREVYNMRNYECSFNPTAEEMANYLAYEIIPTLLGGTKTRVVEVQIYETENCSASAYV